MTYASPAHPPPTRPQSSGPKRWVWFVVGIAGGLVVGLIGAGIFTLARVASGGSDDERPNIEALVGENYCYRIAEKLGMDYVGDDLSGDAFGLDYGGTCTLTEANPASEEFGHRPEASFEVELRNLHPDLMLRREVVNLGRRRRLEEARSDHFSGRSWVRGVVRWRTRALRCPHGGT